MPERQIDLPPEASTPATVSTQAAPAMSGVGAALPSARAALMQIAPTLGDQARNQALHLDGIRQAREAGANLIVFPELSLTGYFLRDMVPEVALPRHADELAELAQAAGGGRPRGRVRRGRARPLVLQRGGLFRAR